jgi:hypothetical protein
MLKLFLIQITCVASVFRAAAVFVQSWFRRFKMPACCAVQKSNFQFSIFNYYGRAGEGLSIFDF